MAKVTTNWDSLRQEMTNDLASMIKETRGTILNDIENRLVEKGLSSEKTGIDDNKVVFATDDKQEFGEGKTYFDEVYEEINNDPDWIESL